jgi:hypothetical protein
VEHLRNFRTEHNRRNVMSEDTEKVKQIEEKQLDELSEEDLEQVPGGTASISIMKVVDKTSPL